METKFGITLNVIISLVVALSGIYFLLELRKIKNQIEGFVYSSYWCWFISWWFWVILWGVQLAFPPSNNTNSIEMLTTVLSDFNTLFLILFYLSFTRGNDYKDDFIKAGISISICFVFLVFTFYGVSYFSSLGMITTGNMIHNNWSIALSMISTILVGWSFNLRHQTKIVLFVAVVYAAMQPIAYFLLENNSFNPNQAQIPIEVKQIAIHLNSKNTTPIFSENTKDIIFVVLAALKIIWATTVTYFIGFKPLTSENLIREIDENIDHTFNPSHLKSQFSIWRTLRDKKSEKPFANIFKKLSKSWQIKISKGGELQKNDEDGFNSEMLRVLNDILKDISFYHKPSFDGFIFSKRTKNLLKKYNNERNDRVFETLNRSLLEDLFKKELKTSFWLSSDWEKMISILLFVFGFVVISFSIYQIFKTGYEHIPASSWFALSIGLIGLTKPILDLTVWILNYKSKK